MKQYVFTERDPAGSGVFDLMITDTAIPQPPQNPPNPGTPITPSPVPAGVVVRDLAPANTSAVHTGVAGTVYAYRLPPGDWHVGQFQAGRDTNTPTEGHAQFCVSSMPGFIGGAYPHYVEGSPAGAMAVNYATSPSPGRDGKLWQAQVAHNPQCYINILCDFDGNFSYQHNES